MIRLSSVYLRQHTLSMRVLVPATSRSVCSLPRYESSLSGTASAFSSPSFYPITLTTESHLELLFTSATDSSRAIVAPFITSSIADSSELLMSSIIKKRKKKMNKHKWKKRRRLVRYKNKP